MEQVSAGWHLDPAGSGQLRWWDGTAWTDHLAPPPPTPHEQIEPAKKKADRERDRAERKARRAERAAERRATQFVASYGGVTLYANRLTHGREIKDLEGVQARVESGSEIQSRVTATRLLAIGVFAFAAKKKSGGESYLTIEGPDFFWTIEVDRKKRSEAVAFAAKVNNQVRSLAGS